MKTYFLFLLSLCISFSTIASNQNIEDNGCLFGNCVSGYGSKDFEEGNYEGFFEKGKRTGPGSMQYKSGMTYVGEWKNDKVEGFGFFSNPEGNPSTIIGNFVDGKLIGKGMKLMSDNTIAAGIYDNDILNELYDFDFNGVEIGCTFGDCFELYGRFIWETGDQFNGFFTGSNMDFGTYIFGDGGTYIGSFDKEAFLSKVGIYVYPNGDFYFGNWSKGEFNGLGVFSYSEDEKYTAGMWKKGKFVKAY
jgi:hypothetical protein